MDKQRNRLHKMTENEMTGNEFIPGGFLDGALVRTAVFVRETGRKNATEPCALKAGHKQYVDEHQMVLLLR